MRVSEQVDPDPGRTVEPDATARVGAGWPPPAGRHQPKRRRWPWVAGIAAGVVVLAVIASGALLASRTVQVFSRPDVGLCIRPVSGDEQAGMVDCGDPGALGRIIAVDRNADSPTVAQPDCPDQTDAFVDFGHREVACVEALKPPHPGEAGKGGGILRAGDCVRANPGQGPALVEVPCAGEYAGRVTGRSQDPASCPQGTVETAKLTATVRPVLCIGNGPGVFARGDCVVERPPVGLEEV